MKRTRTTVCLPIALITDPRLSSNAKIIYALLKSLSKGKSPESGQTPVVTVAYRQLTERSGLSRHTVVKSLRFLEGTGWIRCERCLGSANRYVVTAPRLDWRIARLIALVTTNKA